MFSSKFILNSAVGLIGLAVFSLTWRIGWPWSQVKFFEILFLPLIPLTFWLILKNLDLAKSLISREHLKGLLVTLSLLVLAPLLGYGFSYFSISEAPSYFISAGTEWLRLVFALLVFVSVAWISLLNPKTTSTILGIMAVSPLFLWLVANSGMYRLFVSSLDERLRAPGNDPNYLGSWLALGLIISFSFFINNPHPRRFLGLLGVIFTLPLLLWTSSRGALVAAVLGLGAVILFVLLKNSFRAIWIKISLGILGIFLGCLIALSPFAPGYLGISMRQRLTQPIFGKVFPVRFLVLPETGLRGIEVPDSGRLQILLRGANIFITHPFGLGPASYHFQPVSYSPEGNKLGSHNVFLEAGIAGGYLGLFCLVYVFWFIFRRAKVILKENSWTSVSLVGCLVALIGASLFLDTLTLRWLWIVLGLISAESIKPNRATYASLEEYD